MGFGSIQFKFKAHILSCFANHDRMSVPCVCHHGNKRGVHGGKEMNSYWDLAAGECSNRNLDV